MDDVNLLKQEILEKVRTYYLSAHAVKPGFISGKSYIPYAGRVFDQDEMVNLVDAALEFWLTAGCYSDTFERKLAGFIGIKHCLLVNSGSSANLLAFMALTSPRLKDRQIHRGDEVITVAAGFPTTVAPIIQYGAVPVFVDVELGTYNVETELLEVALSTRTKAVMLAHTLGNPFNAAKVTDFCRKNGLWLIEDNCDALGSRYGQRYTGTFGDIATGSFYPPHHITTGEGGAVYTDRSDLFEILRSMRDWGRDCKCPSGRDNTCGRRFGLQLGDLPMGYDHKYVYSHFGYNLKATDLQAAVGCAQIDKLPYFIEKRRINWQQMKDGLDGVKDIFILPQATENSEPSWFGFQLTVNEDAPFSRDDIVAHLESNMIQTRMLFAGNLLRHPCFDDMRKTGKGFRIVGDLTNTDRVMNHSFWVGVYPALTAQMIGWTIDTIIGFAVDGKKHQTQPARW